MKTLIIGAGQCGNALLYLLDKEYLNLSSPEGRETLEVIYVNLNQKDLTDRVIEVEATHNRYYYSLDQGGTGRDIKEGLRLFQKYDDKTDMVINAVFKQKRYDEIIIITSAGGGTGSSFTVFFINRLLEEAAKYNHGEIRITIFAIYPFVDEPLNFHANAIIFTKNLLDIIGKIANTKIKLTILPVPNSKIQEKSKTNQFDTMNEYIVKNILASSFRLLNYTKPEPGKTLKFFKTLDKAEFERIGAFAKIFLVDEDEIVKLKLENDNFFKRANTLHIIKTGPSKTADWYSRIIDRIAPNNNLVVLAGETYSPNIDSDYIIVVSNIQFKNEVELFETLYEAKIDITKKITAIKQMITKNKLDVDTLNKISENIDI